MSSDKPKGPSCDISANPDEEMSRRDFLEVTSMWACVGAWTLATIGLLKFPKPALLPDVSKAFKIGKPEEFPVNSEKILEDKKVLIKRDEEGIYAVSLICTHLGCIVAKEEKGGYSCPCHGSKFDEKGHVVAGPAPGPLYWLDVSMHPSGKLLVNSGKKVPVGTKYTV